MRDKEIIKFELIKKRQKPEYDIKEVILEVILDIRELLREKYNEKK